MITCVKSRPLQKIKFTPIDNRPKVLTPNNKDVLRGTKATETKRPNEIPTTEEKPKRPKTLAPKTQLNFEGFDSDNDEVMAGNTPASPSLSPDFVFDDNLGDLPPQILPDDMNKFWGSDSDSDEKDDVTAPPGSRAKGAPLYIKKADTLSNNTKKKAPVVLTTSDDDDDDEVAHDYYAKLDKHVVLRNMERIDIETLQAFAGSEEGKKKLSEFKDFGDGGDDGDSRADNQDYNYKPDMSMKEIIDKFLRNIDYKETYEVHFARSRIGHMLCLNKCTKASRLYATRSTGYELYPWSVTQLPRPIRSLAQGKIFQQNDDSSAFQRILLGKTKVKETRDMLKRLTDNKNKFYDDVIQQINNPDLTRETVKEQINALANGQALRIREKKLDGTCHLLQEWARIVGRKLTKEICSTRNAKKAIALLKKHFPKKRTKRNNKSALIDRNCQITYRAQFQEQYEALALLEKIQFFKENNIEHGSPVHDDVPCKRFDDEQEREDIGIALTCFLVTGASY